MLLSRQAQVNGTDVDSGCTETKLLCRARYGWGREHFAVGIHLPVKRLRGEGKDMVPETPPISDHVGQGLIPAMHQINSSQLNSIVSGFGRAFCCRGAVALSGDGWILSWGAECAWRGGILSVMAWFRQLARLVARRRNRSTCTGAIGFSVMTGKV